MRQFSRQVLFVFMRIAAIYRNTEPIKESVQGVVYGRNEKALLTQRKENKVEVRAEVR